MYYPVKIGRKETYGDGSIGGESRILSAIFHNMFAHMPKPHTYEYGLWDRVVAKLSVRCHEITRQQNKKLSRRYVHWNPAAGRYMDEGE